MHLVLYMASDKELTSILACVNPGFLMLLVDDTMFSTLYVIETFAKKQLKIDSILESLSACFIVPCVIGHHSLIIYLEIKFVITTDCNF